MSPGRLPTFEDAGAGMARVAEELAELAAQLRGLSGMPDRLQDAELLDRIARRVENAAAQLELDRRLVAEVRGKLLLSWDEHGPS